MVVLIGRALGMGEEFEESEMKKARVVPHQNLIQSSSPLNRTGDHCNWMAKRKVIMSKPLWINVKVPLRLRLGFSPFDHLAVEK
jgi:hypothetical protein